MVFNRFYILELTNDNLNSTWSASFSMANATRAPIVLVAKSVLLQDELALLVESVAADVTEGEGGYVKAGLSLSVYAHVSAAALSDRLKGLANAIRQGHGF